MSLLSLKRYSKPRGAGDQTSGGRGKLLRATSALTRIELVVRETLQNSWDARENAHRPTYGVRIYRMEEEVRRALGQSVFTDLPDSMRDLAESLVSSDLHAVEIFDRGTTGLDGPYRASEVAGDGEANNFNSFVFDIGTTTHSDTSGGTYGFGKTATFEVSRAHSVIYWSRCRTANGELEHRLIASSLHDPYDEGGARYTGAHWWGAPDDPDIVPIRGDQADRLGRALFRTHFGDEETGTSIMIIDPVISIASDIDAVRERVPVRTDAHADLLTDQVADALAYSAWPKTIPADGVNPPMIIALYKNGIEQGIAARIREQYRRFADSLIQVRLSQGQQEDGPVPERPSAIVKEETFPIRLRPGRSMSVTRERVFGGREDNVVGHVHVAVSVRDLPEIGSPRANALCLMRSEAELVVRYEDVVDVDDELLTWHAVFKPAPEIDRHFAASEPPTHDSWNPVSAEDEVSTYVVDKSLQQIRTKVRRFLEEHRSPAIEGQRSVRGVAAGLRGFVPFGIEQDLPSATPRRRVRNGAGGRQKPRAVLQVLAVEPLADGAGQKLTLQVDPAEVASVYAEAQVYAITADGRLALESTELVPTWRTALRTVEGLAIGLAPGEIAELELRTRVATAIDVDLRTEQVS